MKPIKIIAVVLLTLFASASGAQSLEDFELDYDYFTLKNGLRVVVAEDFSSTTFGLNVIYFVGSRDEEPGKTGLAHLYEHMMFRPTAFNPVRFQEAMKQLGGGAQGGTLKDYTSYFAGGPVANFEAILALEADRMASIRGSITQQALNVERDIVINELRQKSSMIARMSARQWPDGHPYTHTPGGSAEDLLSLSVEEVAEFGERFYGPDNAVLIINGGVGASEARRVISKLFREIPPVGVDRPFTAWVPEERESDDIHGDANDAGVTLRRSWHVAPGWTEDAVLLELLSSVLNSEHSQFNRQLSDSNDIVASARVSMSNRSLVSEFAVRVIGNASTDVEELRAALDSSLAWLTENGITERALASAKRSLLVAQVNAALSNGGREKLIVRSIVDGDDPGHYRYRNRVIAGATADDLKRIAQLWLGNGETPEKFDRPSLPKPATLENSGKVASRAVSVRRHSLRNGVPVAIVADNRAALTTLYFEFDRGWRNHKAQLPAVARIIASQLQARLRQAGSPNTLSDLGTTVRVNVAESAATLTIGFLDRDIEPVLNAVADVLSSPKYVNEQKPLPSYPPRTGLGAGAYIQPKVLYGDDHPYGSEAHYLAVASATEAKAIHRAIFRPDALRIVARTSLHDGKLVGLLQCAFGAWKSRGADPAGAALPIPPSITDKQIIYIDNPGSGQADVRAGSVIHQTSPESKLAFAVGNEIFGRGNGRIDTVLREQHGWTYGFYTDFNEKPEYSVWTTRGSVQADKLDETVEVIESELDAFLGERPPTEAEVHRVSSRWITREETRLASLDGILRSLRQEGRPGLTAEEKIKHLRSLGPDDVLAAWRNHLDPSKLVWIITADFSQIDAPVIEPVEDKD